MTMFENSKWNGTIKDAEETLQGIKEIFSTFFPIILLL